MKSHQTRGLQAFRRIEAWFVEHPQVIPASGSSAAALSNQVDALKLIVASMTARAAEQASESGQATLAAKDEATQRQELRSLHLKSIGDRGRGVARESTGDGRVQAAGSHLEL